MFTPRFSVVDYPSSAFTPFPYSPEHALAHAATPAVHLESTKPLRDGRGGFDPIPFAPYHRALDGKYAMGKFSLPSPPPDGDEVPLPLRTFGIANFRSVSASSSSSSPGRTKRRLSYFPQTMGKDGDSLMNGDMSDSNGGWRLKYVAATDPRVSVVKKLIGVKRKMAEQGRREKAPAASPSWVREYEEWEGQRGDKRRKRKDKGKDKALPGALSSSAHTDTDIDADTDTDTSDTESTMSTATTTLAHSTSPTSPHTSRPSTPLPAYLPLGPTLLHTHFAHAALLPLAAPLRPHTHLHIMNHPTPTATPSVPTPVSPAATADRGHALEAAARCVAGEVVENALWAEAWAVGGGAHTTTATATSSTAKKGSGRARRRRAGTEEMWLADVKIVSQLLAGVDGVEGPLELGKLFSLEPSPSSSSGSSSAMSTPTPQHKGKSVSPVRSASAGNTPGGLQLLSAPLITVSKGDAVIQVLPPAVRFWEKLGLGPKGGRKDGTVFVLFEDAGEQRMQQVENWMEMVAATYEVCFLSFFTSAIFVDIWVCRANALGRWFLARAARARGKGWCLSGSIRHSARV